VRLRVRGAYAPNRKEIHDRVRAEAGNRCIRCGHPNETVTMRVGCDERCTHPPDGKQRILTVHHLDGDKGNNRWWNTLALCQSCHLSVQGRVIPERPWLFQHTGWFVPYVCGFYAWYYAEVEITRAEAIRETGRWLLMGQPWREELRRKADGAA